MTWPKTKSGVAAHASAGAAPTLSVPDTMPLRNNRLPLSMTVKFANAGPGADGWKMIRIRHWLFGANDSGQSCWS